MSKNLLKFGFLFTFFYYFLYINVNSIEINACIKKAVENKVKLNRILTLCRDNINALDVYSNSYIADNNEITSDGTCSTPKSAEKK